MNVLGITPFLEGNFPKGVLHRKQIHQGNVLVKNYLEGAIISGATLAKKKRSSHVQFKYIMKFISRCFNCLNRNF